MAPLEEGLGRNDELREGLVHLWIGLDEGGKDLGVLPEVTQEGIAAPASHDLHSFYRHALKQIEQGGTYAYTMPLEQFLACLPGS